MVHRNHQDVVLYSGLWWGPSHPVSWWILFHSQRSLYRVAASLRLKTLPKNRCTFWSGCLEDSNHPLQRSFNFRSHGQRCGAFLKTPTWTKKRTHASVPEKPDLASFLFYAAKQQTNIWKHFLESWPYDNKQLTRNMDRNRCWILRVSVRNQKI